MMVPGSIIRARGKDGEMSDGTGSGGRQWRVAVLAVAVAGIALFAAACGGGPASSGGARTGSMQSKLLAFSSCMRAHGVPGFPDPQPGGGFTRSALNPIANTPQFRSAENACKSLALAAGFEHTPAQLQKHIEQLTAEDACIRKHGVPNMPDPNAQGGQSFPANITPTSPLFQAAQKACAYLNP
jgi:hypothetical protein